MKAAPVTALLCLSVTLTVGSAVAAQGVAPIGRAFADHCFSPYLTAEKARALLDPSGARVDFYDLRPFSSAPPSPVVGRPATEGTDRRCEVALDGAHVAAAVEWIKTGLSQEGLGSKQTAVPETFDVMNSSTFVAAAQLNPDRIAVVQAGVRETTDGPETYMNVERLVPLSEASQ